MTINTKFNVGDRVFFFDNSGKLFPELRKGKIEFVEVAKNGIVWYNIYANGKNFAGVAEKFTFTSEKEARAAVNGFIKIVKTWGRK